MFVLNNETPFAAERTLIADKNGRDVWVVAARATIDIAPDGRLYLADEQQPVALTPEFFGDPLESGLQHDTDLDYCKLTTDVVLHGSAYAPDGEPVQHLEVTMKVGKIDKSLRVFGDRVWKKSLSGLEISSPESFATMPLVWERAFGGVAENPDEPDQPVWEPRNPIGRGMAAFPDQLRDQPLPNLERSEDLITTWRSRPAPICYAPVARHWQPRRQWAGTYDQNWEASRQPLLPVDFDERFFQTASEDQQSSEFMLGGELVELTNLTPSGFLSFRLPRFALRLTTNFANGSVTTRPNLVTVVLHPDRPAMQMIWHAAVPCHQRKYSLQSSTLHQKLVIGGRDEPVSA